MRQHQRWFRRLRLWVIGWIQPGRLTTGIQRTQHIGTDMVADMQDLSGFKPKSLRRVLKQVRVRFHPPPLPARDPARKIPTNRASKGWLQLETSPPPPLSALAKNGRTGAPQAPISPLPPSLDLVWQGDGRIIPACINKQEW